MADRLGIIAGLGGLPAALLAANPDALCVGFEGADLDLRDDQVTCYRIEHLGALFDGLRAGGVTRVVMAGRVDRPAMDPAQLDPLTLSLAPRIMAAIQSGDDGVLRFVIEMIEEQGFRVIGAHELLPDLTAEPGLLAGPAPGDAHLADIARARQILTALAPVDVGQACVVAGGQCLGIESLQGTDALLRFVADTPDELRRGGGVLVKRPKEGQDLRADMPAIGPGTILAAQKAGLDGIAIAAREVLLIDRAELIRFCEEAGLFILAEAS